jgi:hypothetical protein
MFAGSGFARVAVPFVNELTLDNDTVANPTWRHVAESLERIFSARRGFLQMFGQRGMMSVCPSEEFGFYVSAYGENELAEHLLVDPPLGLAPVVTVLGGASDSFPRCVFVDKSLVIQAASEFFHSGRRTSELSWVDPFALAAEAGIT